MKIRLCVILSTSMLMAMLTACGAAKEDSAVLGISREVLEEAVIEEKPDQSIEDYIENDDFGYGPSDFVQEQSGKYEFDSYDDVIANLTEGQGYAYVELKGEEDKLLAVTELVFLADNSASEACIYGMRDGKAVNIGNVFGNGSAFPLRIEDGIIYGGDNHRYETYFISEEWKSLMMKDYVSDGVVEGSGQFVGFTRQTSKYEDTVDYDGGREGFDAYMAEREEKPILVFTMVE